MQRLASLRVGWLGPVEVESLQSSSSGASRLPSVTASRRRAWPPGTGNRSAVQAIARHRREGTPQVDACFFNHALVREPNRGRIDLGMIAPRPWDLSPGQLLR